VSTASALTAVATVVPAGLQIRRTLPRQSPHRWSSLHILSSISRLLHWSPIRDTPSPPSPLPARSTRRDRHVYGKRPSCGSVSARPPTLSLLRLPLRNSSSPRLQPTTRGHLLCTRRRRVRRPDRTDCRRRALHHPHGALA
jgi:hypothetical protein